MAKKSIRLSGHNVKTTRLCIVRRVYNNQKIDVRTLSTIYSDKIRKLPAKNFKINSK